jgi:hypothetical protein
MEVASVQERDVTRKTNQMKEATKQKLEEVLLDSSDEDSYDTAYKENTQTYFALEGRQTDIKTESFTAKLICKIEDIKDLLEGRVKPSPVEEPMDYSSGVIKRIEEMKKIVSSMYLTKNIQNINTDNTLNYLNIINITDDNDGNENESSNETHGIQWFNGCVYTCKKCQKATTNMRQAKFHFRSAHSKVVKQHNIELYASVKISKYTCKICLKLIKHEWHNIYSHLKSHSLTITEYQEHCKKIEGEAKTTEDNEKNRSDNDEEVGPFDTQEESDTTFDDASASMETSNADKLMGLLRKLNGSTVGTITEEIKEMCQNG